MGIAFRAYNRVMAVIDGANGNEDSSINRIIDLAIDRLEGALERESFRRSIGHQGKKAIEFNLTAIDLGFHYYGIGDGAQGISEIIAQKIKPIADAAKTRGLDIASQYIEQLRCPDHGESALLRVTIDGHRL
ncbi:MAG: hypothetical protein HRT94_01780 [Alphaproteobacteria bacterium]|nr:hypothetical protein [Alphaproteobacteria bacterium]